MLFNPLMQSMDGVTETTSSGGDLPPFVIYAVVAIVGILVLWIGLGYLWNNKYRPKRVKAGHAVAPFNNILGRVLRFLFKEDKVPSPKIKNPVLAKLLVWRNFYLVCIIATAGFFFANNITMGFTALGVLLLTAWVRTQKVFHDRHRILMRMFDVASVGLSYPKEANGNPWSWVNIKKWEDMTTPGDTVIRFPAKFKSGELKNREAFENHFSTTVTDGNSWIFTWKGADSAVNLQPVTHLPTMAMYPGSSNGSWDEIPLGIGTNGEVVWEVSKNPHALVTGTTGAGKSVLQRNLIFHCIQHSDRWRFLGIDVKMVELTPFLKYEPTVMGVATNVEDGVELVRYANEEMQNRYKIMTEQGVNHFLKLKQPPHALMVMIDESYAFLAVTGNKTDEGKARDQLKGEASAAIGDIARLGRAAGVHLVMATQRPDATVIYGELKQNLSARIAAGRADTIASQMTLDNDNATRLPGIKGRGYFQKDGQGEQFQGYFAEASWIDEWLESQDGSGSHTSNSNEEKVTETKGKAKKSGNKEDKPKKRLGIMGKLKEFNEREAGKDADEIRDDLDEIQSILGDDNELIDPLKELPDFDADTTKKELASLVGEFEEVEETDYNNPFGVPNLEKPSEDKGLQFDDEDDPFGDEVPVFSPEKTTLNKEPSAEENLNSIFGSLDDDDDDFEPIFEEKPKEQKKASAANLPSSTLPVSNELSFDDDDDDSFFSDFEPVPPKPKTLPKAPVPSKGLPVSPVGSKPQGKPSAPSKAGLPPRPAMPKRPNS